MKKKLLKFVNSRTFWIQVASVAVFTVNEFMPVIPKEYIVYANIGLTLLNRYIKASKEVK
jgi:hypothetical protein